MDYNYFGIARCKTNDLIVSIANDPDVGKTDEVFWVIVLMFGGPFVIGIWLFFFTCCTRMSLKRARRKTIEIAQDGQKKD